LQKLDNYGAEAITNAVEQVLVSNDIAELKVVAQTYDSAAVMSGSGRACLNIKHPMVMSVNALLKNFPAVMKSLQMIKTPTAVGLLSKLS